MAPLRVSILGTGLSLQAFHYPLIASLPDKFIPYSVLERSGKGKAQEVCGPDIKVVKTIEEVVDDPLVDVVVISTPNNTHYPFAKAALEKNKHVMVEKPMTTNLAEAEELFELAKSKNLVLCTYQNRRWDGDYLTLQKLIKSGQIGPVHEFNSAFDRYRPLPPNFQATDWKYAAGHHNEALYNLGSHVIDQTVALFGVPLTLSCRSWDQRGIGLDEAMTMTLTYPPQEGSKSPLVVNLRATMLAAAPKQVRYEVVGGKGRYLKFGLDPQEPFLRAGKKVTDEGYGVEPKEEYGELDVCEDGKWATSKLPTLNGWYPAIYENLHEAITSNDPSKLVVKPEQVLWTMRLIELGFKSSAEGRVIEIKQ